MILTSAMSLDRMYLPADSISNTTGFISINTEVFKYNDFKAQRGTEPYKPNDEYWLFTTQGTQTWEHLNVQSLILLGQTKDFTPGQQ